ncbi:P-loop containing nucleoside triphosphate hydrolase protein [Lasiosphaeris hirsuta]|uniref:P-loop containing nucleoside triphosphate hydrolase protein n=1 Tax=Lasiosphaeris hirsuta TaxID=260670 RepID=A0AA40E5Y8_9PEZI|nr:P-loop containing nucleoside triphosphate hydrolase protein [Lasiosphaeris hirsuta]
MASPSIRSSTVLGQSTTYSSWSANKEAPFPQDAIIDVQETTTEKESLPSPKSCWKDLFAFTRGSHRFIIACAVITSALVAGGRTAYAIVLGKIFGIVSQRGANQLDGDDFLSQISRWSGYMCLLGLGMWLISSIDIALWVMTGELRARTAREMVFDSLLHKATQWYDSREDGISSMTVGIQTQIRELQMATSQILGYLISDIFIFLACIIVAFAYSYKLTLVMLSTGIPSALILWFISRFLDPAIEAQKRELAEASKQATAATTAIDLVKVYNGADHEAFRFISAIRRSAKYYSRQVLCNCGQMSYIKFWTIMLFVIGFYFAVVLVNWGELTPGDALTTFYTAVIAFRSVEALGPQWLVIAKGMAAGQLLKRLVSEGEHGQGEANTAGSPHTPRCFGEIELSDVSFAYPSNPTKTVLYPSSFQFPAGQLTFVIGKSGSGKSTLANLLLRFYEPLTGRITVDNNLITRLDLQWLRSNITLIQQSSILFNDTFLRNVAFGARDPDKVTLAEVQEACNMALLQSTIAGMPDGLHTEIGPNGYALSGGQRQRLALARAKLRDPPVLILDEITSGLDPASRALIMEAIRMWRKGKTTIIITHEVGHIGDDEYVYAMENGHVVQSGFRKKLSEVAGLFASLLASADEVTSSRHSSANQSDYDSDSDAQDEDEPVVGEARYERFLRGLLVDRRKPDGLFNRIPLPGERIHTAGYLGGSPGGSRRNSDAGSINVVTRMGLDIQNNRISNARRPRMRNNPVAESNASLRSLELFFLERLAKSKDRKAGLAQGPRLPSMTAILRTVWPTLDSMGKIQLALGLLMCLVMAGSNPVFSFIFTQLLGTFWLPEGRQEAGSKWASYLTIVAVVDAASIFLAYLFMERAAQKWVNALRAEAIKRILSQPKSWFDKPNHSPSRIAQCLDRNAEEMRKLLGMFVPILLTVTCMILSSLIWALVIRWDLTLVTLAGAPVAIGTARANSLVSDKWESICDQAAEAAGTVFSETFSNIRVVRALTLEGYFTNKHTQSAAAAYRVGVKRSVFVGVFYGLFQSITFFLNALVFFYGAKILSENLTTVTDVLRVINLLLFSLGTSVGMLSNIPQIAASKATATQLLYYANLSHITSHEAQGEELITTPLPVHMTNLQFAYPGAPNKQVLRNVDLEIESGTSTAIVGASGCGKSTIAALLLRLYDPKPSLPPVSPSPPPGATLTIIPPTPSHRPAGSPLTYAHRPSVSLNTASLRTYLAYVPQHPFLFSATVRDNITYGLHASSPLRAQASVEAAARAADIHDLVVSLPQGYDTLVGEGGIAVSGGQAQRLGIARALVRRPRMVVMDEPTSALDAEGAEGVRRLVKQLARQGVGVVVVTHSKEMMRVVDRVVMVESGRVVETGAYDELVGRQGMFAQLVGGGVWMWNGEGRRRRRSRRNRRGEEAERVLLRQEALRRLEGGEASGSGERYWRV